MHLCCKFAASIARTSSDDYIRDVCIHVLEYDESGAEEFLLGRIECQQILWSEIELDGQNAYVVCDELSGDLEAIHAHLMDRHGTLRDEFQADAHIDDVVVLERMVLHPDILDCSQHLLEAALNLFGISVLVISWREVPLLSEKELAELGFRKAAATNLIYRHSALRRSYEGRYPRGYEILVEGTIDHEDWVLTELTKGQ